MSDDGHSLVWLLLPRFYGRVVTANSNEHGSKKYMLDQKLVSMPALAVFTDGKLRKFYHLSDFVRDPEHVHLTGSHTIWREEERQRTQTRFTTDEQYFLFETVGSHRYIVNLQTGTIQLRPKQERGTKHP